MDSPTQPRRGMSNHWLLLLLFAATLATVAVALPGVKAAIDLALTRSTVLHRTLRYQPGGGAGPATYDIARVARRLLMLVALVLLIVCRRRLDIASLTATGLRRRPGWLRELAVGVGVGVGSLAAFAVVLALIGAWRVAPSPKPVLALLGKSLVAGAAVGLIEEVLFRGFLLQSLAGSLGTRWALVWSSAFYSVLHFFQAKVRVPVGFDSWIGFRTVGEFFKPLLAEPAILATPSRWDESIVPGTLGLFLVGMVLGYAFVRSRGLYVSIGLHGGWVFMLKFQRAFIDRAGHDLDWLYGDKQVVTGVLGWVFLIALWAALPRLVRKAGEPESQGMGPGAGSEAEG